MARIPTFKNLKEERDFWATHSFADFVDDTEEIRVQDDSNTTRRRTWPIHVYLEPDEAIGLDEMARQTGEAKNHIVRQALRRFMKTQVKSIGFDPLTIVGTLLRGIHLEKISPKITSIGIQFFSDNPIRDFDLAKKLKSVLLLALPGCVKVEVMVHKRKGSSLRTISDLITDECDIQGDLTERDRAKIVQAIRTIVKRSIVPQLASRHFIDQAA